jgi:hypothetical protein
MMRGRAPQKSRINPLFAQKCRSSYEPSGNRGAAAFIGPTAAATQPRTAIQGDHMRCNHCKRVLGLVEGFLHSTSIVLANQLLRVGSSFDFQCVSVGICIGEANAFDLSKSTQ